MSGITTIKRKGFRGGGADSGASDKKSVNERASKGYGATFDSKPDRTRTTETQDYNTYKATDKNPLNLDIERIERFGGPTLTPQEILKKKNQNLFYDNKPTYSKYIPSYLKIAGNFNRTPNRKHFYDKVLKNNAANLNYTDLEKAYEEYMSNRMSGATDAYGNPIINNSGDNQQPYIPMNYNTAAAEPEEEETIDYRFGDNQNVIYDQYGDPGYRTTAAEGGIMGTRARRAMGGIMNRVDKRQGYFLGKIVKGVKSAIGGVADATKKVLKSDVGKMALAGAAFMYGPKLFGAESLGGFGGYGELVPKIANNKFFSGALLNSDKDGFNPFKVAGIAGLGALSLFGNKAKPNETNFSDRGGSLKNSQGLEGNQAIRDEIYEAYESGDQDRIMQLQKFYGYKLPALNAVQDISLPSSLPYPNYAQGGRIGKAEGGLMDLGGMEKDYRNDGGFVPIGEYEKKDDVPARLSVNEFVFTADAVRGAGQGDIDKGAEIMENMMENLENGGTVSEESQGNKGAQQMFETSERLGAVI